jgi:hypothetical protein
MKWWGLLYRGIICRLKNMNFKKMKIEYILLGILAVGLVLISGGFFKKLNFADNSQQVERGQRVEIFAGDTIEQRFVSENNGFSNLKILFGNKTLKEGGSLKIVLFDENCKKSIVEKMVVGKYEFDSKYLYDFNFAKIDDSRNKKYCLKMELSTKKEWSLLQKIKGRLRPEKKQGLQKLRLFEQIDGRDKSIEGYIIKNKAGKIKSKGKGEIVFRQSYKNSTVVKDFQQLNQRMSQYKPWFLKGGYLTAIILFAIILTVGSIMSLVQLIRNK